MGEKRHIILTGNKQKASEIEKKASVYYSKVDVWYDRRSQLYIAEIVCRDSEWNLIKKVLPRVRKEGFVYGA